MTLLEESPKWSDGGCPYTRKPEYWSINGSSARAVESTAVSTIGTAAPAGFRGVQYAFEFTSSGLSVPQGNGKRQDETRRVRFDSVQLRITQFQVTETERSAIAPNVDTPHPARQNKASGNRCYFVATIHSCSPRASMAARSCGRIQRCLTRASTAFVYCMR